MASRSLGVLTIDLIARISGFVAGMDKAARSAENTSRRTKKSLGELQGVITGVFGALTTGVIAVFIKRQFELGEALNNAAIKSGIASEAFTQLAYAAKLSGVESDALSGHLKLMQKGLSEAASGTGDARKALAALGITLEQIRSLSPDKQFELLGDRISQLQEPADRTRAAMILFGRSGEDLLPLFEKGAEGIRKAREEAIKLGQSFDAATLQKLDAADDAVTALGTSFSTLATTLTAKLAPGLTIVLRQMAGIATPLENLAFEIDMRQRSSSYAIQRWLTDLENLRRKAIGLGPVIDPGLDAAQLKFAAEQQEAILNRYKNFNVEGATLPGFGDAEKQAKELEAAAKAAEERLKLLQRESDELGKFAGGLTQEMADFFGEQERLTETAAENIVRTFRETRAAIELQWSAGEIIDVDVFNARMEEALDKVVTYHEVTAERMSEVIETETSQWSVFMDEAARGMQNALSDFFLTPMQEGFDGLGKAFADMLRRMVAEAAASKLLETLMPFFGGLFGGGKTLPIAVTPSGSFATGGPMKAGQSYLVGERGPEVISSARNAYVNPITQGAMQPAGMVVNVINPPSPPRIEESEGDDGQQQLNIFFEKMTNQSMAGGALDATMAGRYGLRPIRGGRR